MIATDAGGKFKKNYAKSGFQKINNLVHFCSQAHNCI